MLTYDLHAHYAAPFVLTHGPKGVLSPLWNRTPGGKKKLAKAFLTEFRQKLGGRVAEEKLSYPYPDLLSTLGSPSLTRLCL